MRHGGNWPVDRGDSDRADTADDSCAFDRAWSARNKCERGRAGFIDRKINVDLWTLGAAYSF